MDQRQISFYYSYFVLTLSFICFVSHGGSIGCSGPQQLEHLQPHLHQGGGKPSACMRHQSTTAETKASFLGGPILSENSFVSHHRKSILLSIKVTLAICVSKSQLSHAFKCPISSINQLCTYYEYFPTDLNKAVLCIADNKS